MSSRRLPRVLLVEDDPVSRTFLMAAVQAVPAEVDSADTLGAALSLAQARKYALWLFDANLPDGSGAELLGKLRCTHPHTPALAHTATDHGDVRDALLAAGFLEVLVKPLPASAIQGAVRRVLGLAQKRSETAGRSPASRRPLWDDDAAAIALNGNRAHMQMLRGLFVEELPQLRDRIDVAAAGGDLEGVRAHLHKLHASCGFVGAARLGEAAHALHLQGDSHVALARFDLAVHATLSAVAAVSVGVDQVTQTSED